MNAPPPPPPPPGRETGAGSRSAYNVFVLATTIETRVTRAVHCGVTNDGVGCPPAPRTCSRIGEYEELDVGVRKLSVNHVYMKIKQNYTR